MNPTFKIKAAKIQSFNPFGEETIMELIMRFSRDETGTAALEYAIVLTLIGIALIGAMKTMAGSLIGIFSSVIF
jgi:Flp pilus assembly pilin Flp